MVKMNNDQAEEKKQNSAFQSLDILFQRWKEGTFGEIIEDRKSVV